MLLSFVRPLAASLSTIFIVMAGPTAADTRAPQVVAQSLSQESPEAAAKSFAVYKSPTCGCCAVWVDHLTAYGIPMRVDHTADLNAIKDRYRVTAGHQSCHTAVSPDGYVFEGHIPARLIQRFLKEKPAGALGLTVPGMPLGSPGMEVGDQFTPYDVLVLKHDGSTAVYAHIKSPADQRGGQ